MISKISTISDDEDDEDKEDEGLAHKKLSKVIDEIDSMLTDDDDDENEVRVFFSCS